MKLDRDLSSRIRLRWCAFCCLFFVLSLTVSSQRKNGTLKTDPIGAQIQASGVHGDEQIIVPTDLVSFFVTVSDSHGRNVTGLDKNAFTVTDDKAQQEITFFSAADAPVSIGIIFDLSGSMSEDRIKRAREALSEFFGTSDQRDEYFLVGFNSNAEVLVDRTRNPDLIERSLAGVKPHGETALFDAIRLGVERVAKGDYPRHALLLISDGDENSSRYTFKEVRRVLEESDAVLYSICVLDNIRLASKAGLRIQTIMDGLSRVTGGRVFYSGTKMDEAFYQIALELRHQYSIGYHPTNFANDRQWHRVKVRVTPSGKDARLVVRSRAGYYALPRDNEAGSR